MEGFVRQIIGWREYVRGLYHTLDMRGNHFGHTGKLTKHWYDGTTGIEPLDDCIRRVNRIGYTHHIERLMVVGNIMLLSGIHPDEVHRWFMEMYIDSSDWVMIPNVFGMATFADGGIMSTKPYTCSSNYILKMSNYKKGDWCNIVDGLYWRFVEKNRSLYEKNIRLSFQLRLLERMDPDRKQMIFNKAERFISENTC